MSHMASKKEKVEFVKNRKHMIALAIENPNYFRKKSCDEMSYILYDLAIKEGLYSKKTSFRDVLSSIVQIYKNEI